MHAKQDLPAVEGWYTLDPKQPHLLGARCLSCGSYYFPKHISYCRNPDCEGEAFEELPLSRHGTIWSYTDAAYPPPSPYVCPEPFEPFAIAAVTLEKEQMIVLGQMVRGITPAQLKVGQKVELVLESLYEDEHSRKLVWKWKPND